MESSTFQSESIHSERIAFSNKISNPKLKLIKVFGNWAIQFLKLIIINPEIRIQIKPGYSISREEELSAIQERTYAEYLYKI